MRLNIDIPKINKRNINPRGYMAGLHGVLGITLIYYVKYA